MAKAIGLFNPGDLGTWNDNPDNEAAENVTVTSMPKPKPDNTLLYVGAGILILILLSQSK